MNYFEFRKEVEYMNFSICFVIAIAIIVPVATFIFDNKE